jgi:hypothetical protein
VERELKPIGVLSPFLAIPLGHQCEIEALALIEEIELNAKTVTFVQAPIKRKIRMLEYALGLSRRNFL